jgi:hypothetical protein
MIPRFLQLYGITRVNRNEMIWRVKEAILKGDAYILDFHMFSNKAVCINFEVAVGDIQKLYSALRQEAFLDQESHCLLGECCNQLPQLGESARAKNVTGTLNITFIHNEPDLRIEVPPIPG